MAAEGSGKWAPVAYRANCRDCSFEGRATSAPGANAAGRAHAIANPAHDVYVERHPEVEHL